MAIDTKIQETLKNHTRIKSMRRGGSPEPSCQLPTAPAHTSLIPLTKGESDDGQRFSSILKDCRFSGRWPNILR